MKTSSQMAQEYIDEYPKVERANNECLFDYYVGNNGKEIKGKNRKYLEYYIDSINLGAVFIDFKEKDFWSKVNKTVNPTIYMWGSSILFDFGEDFYYQLCNFDEEIGKTYTYIVNNKKIYLVKYNKESETIEETFESNILIL